MVVSYFFDKFARICDVTVFTYMYTIFTSVKREQPYLFVLLILALPDTNNYLNVTVNIFQKVLLPQCLFNKMHAMRTASNFNQ